MIVYQRAQFIRRIPRRKILLAWLISLNPPTATPSLFKTLQWPYLKVLPLRYPKRRKAIYTLMLAPGSGPVAVPNVVGLTLANAVSAITSIGLTIGTETTAYSPTIPAGSVISQSPTAGSPVATGTPVSLVISLGPAPVAVAVPNIVGQAQAAAVNALTAAGFGVTVTYAYVAGSIVGNVIAQAPIGGTLEFLPFTVIITVAVSQVWPQPSAITDLPGRGTWTLPGGVQALWVFGQTCYLMTVTSPATGTAQATFAMTSVGTLKTSTGQVCIRDNGAGGFAFIVDGPYGYLYNIGTREFKQITDPGFLGADRCEFIDGWMIFNRPGTQTFYTTGPVPYTTTFPGSFFALKDGSTDNLMTLAVNKEELWLPGERTTEIWYNAGGQYFAFQRLVSTMIQTGCVAKHSIARFSAGQESGLAWLALSERGENVVIKTSGFATITISTPAISSEISKYPKIDDAFAYVYTEGGHEFYVLTFPTADKTWVFDFATEMWHRRASYDPYAGQFHRHRSNCFTNFQNQRLVGDYQNGSVYQMTRSAYTDAGWPLVSQRRTPHIWDGGGRNRVFMASLQLDFAPGVGMQTGLGADPQVILKTSRDGGTTYGSEFLRSLGKVGNYLNRVIWRKLSFSRDAVIEVTVIDPVKRDVVGATLKSFNE